MAEENTFEPQLVRTANVAKELIEVAKKYELPIHALDFKILKTTLYIKHAPIENPDSVEFLEISKEDRTALSDHEALKDPTLFLKQVYDIEIFKVTTPLFPHLQLSISGNKSLTSVYAVIQAGSKLEAMPELEHSLFDYLNRRKLRARILIDIWDDGMRDAVRAIAAKALIDGIYTFSEETQILVAQTIGSVPTIDDTFITHFQRKVEAENELKRVNHKERGFITAVAEGELLMTYRKPQQGTPGRDCRGEFLKIPDPLTTHEPKFTVDDQTIEVREDEKKIEYLSKKNGYIDFASNQYYIKENLEVSEISFKSTGNVSAGLNKDISIRVKDSDSTKDAIGIGVEVEASEVDVDGNVGSNAVVRANLIRIGGQTHQSSKLYAPDIYVHVHKGYAQGDKVEVKRLEQGRIEGFNVHVELATGGEIVARDVVIDVLQSHTKITASHSIVIKKMRGSENSLCIDQTRQSENAAKIQALEEKIEAMRIDINISQKKLKEDQTRFHEHKATIEELKRRLVGYKQSGIQPPNAFLQSYKKFQNMHHAIEMEGRDLRLKEENYALLMGERSRFQEDVLEATITNYDIWRGHNEVSFHLTDPYTEIDYIPKEGLRESVISLELNEETQAYEINVTSVEGLSAT